MKLKPAVNKPLSIPRSPVGKEWVKYAEWLEAEVVILEDRIETMGREIDSLRDDNA